MSEIINPLNTIFISSASLWEVAIKINIHKVDFDVDFDLLLHSIEETDFEILPLKDDYLRTYTTLSLIHNDPFDRLLISTCLTDDLTIITKDKNIQQYDVKWMW